MIRKILRTIFQPTINCMEQKFDDNYCIDNVLSYTQWLLLQSRLHYALQYLWIHKRRCTDASKQPSITSAIIMKREYIFIWCFTWFFFLLDFKKLYAKGEFDPKFCIELFIYFAPKSRKLH